MARAEKHSQRSSPRKSHRSRGGRGLKRLVVFLLWVIPSLLFGQGIMIPRRCPGPWPLPPRTPCIELEAPLPVKSIAFSTIIQNQVARTKMEQVFLNPNSWAAEGVFYFPIPESASIEEFALWTGGKRIVGELVEREMARQTYFDIVRRLRDPGLLEYVGKNLFQARVFPIAPGSEQKIELRYSQVLKAEQGTVKYEFPLGAGRNLFRRPIETLSGKIDLQSKIPIKNIYSPTHPLEIDRKGEDRASISFEQSRAKPEQNLVLYYSLSEKEFGLTLLTYREKGKDGYFLALLSPQVTVKENEAVPKDILFVLDTSGSMSEEGKITKAREALKFGIRSLHARDRFSLIHFSSDEHSFETALVPATASNVERAVEYSDHLEANGGTDIDGALLAALKMFPTDSRPHFIVFLTDGLPTVGEQNIARILENVRQENKSGARLFTVGLGYDVNTHLLDPLAEDNHGAADYIAPREDLEVRVSNIFTRVNSPVLTHLNLDLGGLKVYDLYPHQLLDLFKGSQLVLLGRYSNEATVTPKLSGEFNSGKREFSFGPQKFPLESPDSEFIPRLWAIRRIGFLLDQIRLNGESKEVKDEIIQLATQHGIATPYTSFLVTENDRRVLRIGPGAALTSGGVGGLINGNHSARSAPSPMATMSIDMNSQSGSGAVQTSGTLQQLKSAERADSIGLSTVRHVRHKTFVLKKGVWIDSEYDEAGKWPVLRVPFGSEEYFNMAKHDAELAEYFSVGQQVIVVAGNKVYEVTSNQQ